MQSNQYINVSQSQIVDPVIKLLDDIKNRKLKIIIPNEEDIVPSLWNDKRIKRSVHTQVDLDDNSPNIEKPNRLPRIFQSQRDPNFPTAQQKIILNKLKNVPAYVVVSDNQEVVMANPREELEKNVFDWLYTKYYNWFVWREDDGPISVALFFLNKEDAELYLQEIGSNDPITTEKANIHVQMTSLETFYKLNRTSSPGCQAKLVADLEEISKLVFEYIPKNLHPIHPKQKYNKNFYQGNPLYLIKPVYSKNSNKQYQIKDYKISEDYAIRNVFFKLEDAYSAWDHFCDSNKGIQLPLFPTLEIYNMESYLLDLENSSIDVVNETSFIPTRDSFKDIEKNLTSKEKENNLTLSKKITRLITKKSKQVREFYKGIIWVFTSDTLPTEDNAW